MDLSQLEVFLAVAQEKSFSRAAQKLYRTQAAVSQSIRKLEEDVGEVLFDRAFKDGRLTDAGELLFDFAQEMLNVRREATNALKELRSLHQGKLQIGANEYTVMYLLPVLAEFRRLYPRIKVEVKRSRASEIPMQIIHREVDMGVISFPPQEPGLQSIEVGNDSLVLVVGPTHPLASKDQVSITELEMESFAAHNVVSPYRQKVMETFQRYKTPLNITIELPSIEAIKRFIQFGSGVCILPKLAVQNELDHKLLVGIPIKEMKVERKLYLVHRRKSGLSHAGKAFLRLAQSLQPPG